MQRVSNVLRAAWHILTMQKRRPLLSGRAQGFSEVFSKGSSHLKSVSNFYRTSIELLSNYLHHSAIYVGPNLSHPSLFSSTLMSPSCQPCLYLYLSLPSLPPPNSILFLSPPKTSKVLKTRVYGVLQFSGDHGTLDDGIVKRQTHSQKSVRHLLPELQITYFFSDFHDFYAI